MSKTALDLFFIAASSLHFLRDTVYDKTFEGENFRGFRGFGSTANISFQVFLK